jgi:hypothetical protein
MPCTWSPNMYGQLLKKRLPFGQRHHSAAMHSRAWWQGGRRGITLCRGMLCCGGWWRYSVLQGGAAVCYAAAPTHLNESRQASVARSFCSASSTSKYLCVVSQRWEESFQSCPASSAASAGARVQTTVSTGCMVTPLRLLLSWAQSQASCMQLTATAVCALQ